jgi:hypothetical protein
MARPEVRKGRVKRGRVASWGFPEAGRHGPDRWSLELLEPRLLLSALPIQGTAGDDASTYTLGDGGLAQGKGTVNSLLDVDAPQVSRVLVSSSSWSQAFLDALGGIGFAIPAGPSQLDALPWTNISRISMVFSEDVSISGDDLRVYGLNVPRYAITAFDYDSSTRTATWTLQENIDSDVLWLALSDAVVDLVGNRLDGEWTDTTSTYPSGNGSAGGEFQMRINVLPGDADGDGTIGMGDLGVLGALFGGTAAGVKADFNADGIVDAADYMMLKRSLGRSLPPVPDDFGNDAAHAAAIAMGTSGSATVVGTINYGSDVDVFKFDAAVTGDMTVSMAKAGVNDLIGAVRAMDMAGTQLAADDASDCTAQITFHVVVGGRYYLSAASVSHTAGGYVLTAATQADPPPDPLVAEVAVTGEGVDIVDGDSTPSALDGTDFGSVVQGSSAVIRTFRVINAGTAALTTSGLTVPTGYIVTDGLAGSIAAGGYDDIAVELSTDTVGTFAGDISFANNDADGVENPFNFLITGTVTADPTPGVQVDGRVQQIGGTTRLVVAGTDCNDVITLSYDGTQTVLVSGAGTQTFAGYYAYISVYGFGGDDVIRLDYSIMGETLIYAGDGNDKVYENSQGSATVYGGAGDDLLVSVGGGADVVAGGTGFDSFWADSSDTVSDAEPAETAAASVHKITQFYQPYTTDPSSANYVSLEIAGQNLADPATSYGYQSFSASPLFTDGPDYRDIAQGAAGDCYFLAALASIADTDPNIIRQAIAPLGDGTYVVQYYRNGKANYVRVDPDLPASGSSLVYAKTGPDGELWAPLMEKAYASFRVPGQSSYASLDTGNVSTVYVAITHTGTSAQYTSGASASTVFNYLSSNLAAGHPVAAGTYSSASGPIIGNHYYMVQSVQTVGSVQYVTVYNPWGYDGGTSTDSNPGDGLVTLTIAQFMQYFSDACVSLA